MGPAGVHNKTRWREQVTVVVALENALFEKTTFHIAEHSHLFTELTTVYVGNLLQNGNLQMRQTYFVKSKHELQLSLSSFDAGLEKFNFFLQDAIFLVPRITRF